MQSASELTCSIHAGHRTIGNCSACQRTLCSKCLAERKGDKLLCRECSMKDIMDSYDQQREEDTKELRHAETRKEQLLAGRKKLFHISSVAAILAEVIVIVLLAGKVSPKSHHWLVGETFAQNHGTDKCVENIWKIKAAIDRFIRENQRPPASFGELVGPYLRRIPACPASGKRYLYEKVREGVYKFSCPTPRRHGLKELFCDTAGSAPQALPRTDDVE